MNKMFKVLEIIWLVMGCIGIFMCSYSIITKDIQGAKYFLGFTVVCGILYAIRKRQRVKFEKQNEKK
jgi:hypothetical protein